MHELGLMQNVVELLHASARERGIGRITRVKLVVGRFTAALPDALAFAFTVLARGPLLDGAVLEIEEREIVGRCGRCGNAFPVAGYRFVCSRCGGDEVEIISGRELYVDYYEGE